jgi:hypothetical protein
MQHSGGGELLHRRTFVPELQYLKGTALPQHALLQCSALTGWAILYHVGRSKLTVNP